MRKIIITIGVVLALIVIAVIALPFVLDVNQFRPYLQTQIQEKLHRPATVGNLELKIIPFSIRATDIVIGQPAGFTSQNPFLQVKEVFVGVALLPLLTKQVNVKSIQLKSPQIELIRNAAGKWNYETGDETSGSSSGGAGSLSLDELSIDEGEVALLDQKAAKPRDVYEHINVDLQDLGPNRHGKLAASVRLDTMAALLKLQSDFDTTGDALAAKGDLNLASDRSKDPLDVVFDIKRSSNGALAINSMTAKIATLAASANGSVEMDKTPSPVQVHVSTANAPIADLLRLAALYGATLPADVKVDGMLQTDLQVTGTTEQPQFAGKLVATKAQISSKDLAEPVRASELTVDFTPDSLTTQPFTIETGATKVTAQATVKNYASDARQINATLSTAGAKVEELLRMAAAYGVKPEGMNGSGTVSVDMKVAQSGKDLKYSGSGSLRGISLTSPQIPKTLTVASADLKFSDDQVAMERLQAGLGSMHVDGGMSVRNFSKPDITINAHFDQLNVPELTEEFAGPPKPPAKTAKQDTKAAKSTQSSSMPITNITAKGTLSIDKLIDDQIVLSNVKTGIKLASGVLTLDPLTAGLFGGQESGNIVMDLRQADPAFAVKSKLTNVDANQLLSATSSLKGVLTGALSGNADITFVVKPNDNIAKTLNGTFALQMGKGRLNGMPILNEIAAIGKILAFAKRTNAGTEIEKMSGSLAIKNGVANTNDLLIDLGGGSKMSGVGDINLVDQTLSVKATTVLGKDFVAKNAPGGQVGGIMTTVMANQNGEMVVPATISGTFANPKFSPDAKAMADMKLKGLLPTASNPAALTSGVKGIVDAFRGKPAETKQGEQPAQDNGIVGILNQFRKKPQEKPPAK